MNILIKNANIVTMDKNNSVFYNTDIVIHNNKIIKIGTVNEKSDFDKIIDAEDKIVMPGLINAHTHLSMSLLRNYSDDIEFWPWLTEKIWPIEDKIKAEDAYWASLLGIIEMIQSGITCFSDMYFFMEDTARAVCETGIRACLSRGLQGPDKNSDLRLKEAKQLYVNWNDQADGRIKVFLGPHAPYTCDPEYLSKVIELGKELNSRIHIHLSETEKEVEDSIAQYGKSPIQHVDSIGLFELPTIAAHCVHINDEDIEILKNKNVSVVNNPGSNLKLANGFAPVQGMINKGINVALGTDGASSNNNLNMFEEMNLAALVNKAVNRDTMSIPALEAVRMATVNGAKALGLENTIGSIEEGKKADIILIDTHKPHFYPKHNIVSSLVYSAQASDVDTVIIDGKIIMENRLMNNIDVERIYLNIDKCYTRLFK